MKRAPWRLFWFFRAHAENLWRVSWQKTCYPVPNTLSPRLVAASAFYPKASLRNNWLLKWWWFTVLASYGTFETSPSIKNRLRVLGRKGNTSPGVLLKQWVWLFCGITVCLLCNSLFLAFRRSSVFRVRTQTFSLLFNWLLWNKNILEGVGQ